MYGVDTLGVAINTQYLSIEEARTWKKKYDAELNGIPAVLPVQDGVKPLVESIQSHSQKISFYENQRYSRFTNSPGPDPSLLYCL